MKRLILAPIALALLLGAGTVPAVEINVPGDYLQIHDAVQAANPGDIVIVAAGTYTDCNHETEGPGSTPACVIMRPGVTLRGAGPEATIIDAEGLGRGIYVHDTDDVVIEDLQVRGAYAEIYGAGILIRQGSTGAVVRNVTVRENGDGGIVVIHDAEATLTGVDFLANEAKQGGGLAVEEGSTAVITDCVVDDNTAPSGAGIFIRAGCTVTMTGCTITRNAINADFGNGGGVCVQDSHCDISGCEISENTTEGNGGGLVYKDAATGTVEDCDIVGNYTTVSYNFGGGISCQGSSPTLRNLRIIGNAATSLGSDGGGIDIQFAPSPIIENCTLVGNSCSADGLGAGIYVQWGGTPQITNCLITDSVGGAGIYCNFSDGVTVTGSDLFNNEGGDDICGIDGGCNFSADPLYCNAAEGNYRIEPGSPCATGNHPDGGDCGATYVGAFPAGCGNAVGDVPVAGVLLGNAPNPFNPMTTIFFVLDAPGDVVVRIHDLRGHELRSFHRSGVAAGVRHEINWDGRDQDGRSLASGVYLYRLESNGMTTSQRMSLIR